MYSTMHIMYFLILFVKIFKLYLSRNKRQKIVLTKLTTKKKHIENFQYALF